MRYLIALFCLIGGSVAADIHRYEYFSDLPFWESPVQAFQGQNPITAQEAKKLVHVQVGYDRWNRVVDIQTRQGEYSKPFSRGFGTLYLHAVHTKITYTDNTEQHWFFDPFGNQVTAWGEVWEKRYVLDKRGRYLILEFFDKEGSAIENSYGQARFEWLYPGDGSVIESRFNLAGELLPHRPGFQFKRIRLLFDTRGFLRLMQNINERQQLVKSESGAAQYRYFYNREGAFDRWEVLDEKSKPATGPTGTAGEQYSFNEKGWTKIAFFNHAGEPDWHESGAVNWHAKYDAVGNMVKRWFTDKQEQPVTGKFGYHGVNYIYDEKGLYLIRTELYDTRGQLTHNTDGVSKVHYLRNQYGQVLEERYTNSNDELVMDAWRKFAYRTFQYDEQHRQTGSTNFDENGKPVG